MKKKKKKAKQWLSWRFRFFRLTLLMWVTLLAIPAFEAGLRIFFNIETLWYFEYSGLLRLVPFSTALLLSYLTPVIWIWRTHHSWIPQIVKANYFVLTIFGITLVVGLVLPSSEGPFHLATAKMNDHVYYLGYTESETLSSTSVMGLYKCDLSVFFVLVCVISRWVTSSTNSNSACSLTLKHKGYFLPSITRSFVPITDPRGSCRAGWQQVSAG